MEQYLYLDDYINFYNQKLNEIKIIIPYKKTLIDGRIINRKKFLKKFKMFLETNKLNNKIFGESINVIINSSYSEEDKLIIKEVLEELNYKNINFINEINLLKIDKNTLFINYNYSYFYLYYLNNLGNIEMKLYKNDYINKKLINDIFKIIQKDKIILCGKNIEELINIIKNKYYNYFYYEDHNNLYIKLALKN